MEAESSIEGKRHPESGGISPKKLRKAVVICGLEVSRGYKKESEKNPVIPYLITKAMNGAQKSQRVSAEETTGRRRRARE